MTRRRKTLTIVIGAVLAIFAALVTVVYFLQPWRSCPYDDSPAACVIFPTDVVVVAIAMLALMAGLVILGVGLLAKEVDAVRERGICARAELQTFFDSSVAPTVGNGDALAVHALG